MRRARWLGIAGAVAVALAAAAPAARAQIIFPTDSLERWMRHRGFEIGTQAGARFEGDRTQRTMLTFETGQSILVKWAKAPRGGEEFNNVPRFEVAAYELQKLFLDEDEFVVPPTVMRAFPVEWYRQTVDRRAAATFDDASSVLVVLQYWLFNVEPMDDLDEERMERDDAYARTVGNLNVLTYLVDHKDANVGNILISRAGALPRVFSVDNGVAFSSQESDRGDDWGRLQVKRLPRRTVERLRRVTRADLDRVLGVLAQFEVRDGYLEPATPGPSLRVNRGIHKEEGVIQLGLTAREIAGVERRLGELLKRVDEGELELF